MKIELLISLAFNVVFIILLYLQGQLTRQAINAGRNAINLLRETIDNFDGEQND